MDKETVLRRCTIHGNIVKLPDGQLDRKLYQEVAKSLELIGGKWKGKPVFGFVFPENPGTLVAEIASGEKRNLKKEFQFFPTPPDAADYAVRKADIEPDHVVLEPHAGQGAIVQAIHRLLPGKNVNWCELMPTNQIFMRRIAHTTFVCENVFDHNLCNFYDRIVANPPFAKNQDIDHIYKMYDLLKEDGGRLVTYAGKHWQLSKNKKETAFREWLDKVGAEVEEVEAGTFSESGTEIATCIITINK